MPRFMYLLVHYWKNINKIQQKNHDMVALQPVNQLMINSTTTKQAPSSWPSTNLQGNKIRVSGLDTDHWQFANTPEDKF